MTFAGGKPMKITGSYCWKRNQEIVKNAPSSIYARAAFFAQLKIGNRGMSSVILLNNIASSLALICIRAAGIPALRFRLYVDDGIAAFTLAAVPLLDRRMRQHKYCARRRDASWHLLRRSADIFVICILSSTTDGIRLDRLN